MIGDEASFKSKSLIGIMDKFASCREYRYGFTGTLDDTQTHKWVLEGLFGPSYKVTQTKKLQDEGHLAHLIFSVLS